MTSAELAERFGATENIPHDVLYAFLCQDDTRREVLRLVNPYYRAMRGHDESKDKEEKDTFLRQANGELEKFKTNRFILSIRKLCKTDLIWLACYWTWETSPAGEGHDISENRITPESHGPILNFFVKKDDTKKLKDQDKRKLRLLLWPRNGQKSTCDIIDVVQWIINFPEIRILYLTGDNDLAQGFVKETKGHFLVRSDAPSLMNLFFPEFCFEEKEVGNVYEFNSPAWVTKKIYRKEPTVQASSVGSGLGGRHYELIKADDAVYDRNTATEELCDSTTKKLSLTVRPGKMLMQYGYLDRVGTRYHDDDWYGRVIEDNIGEIKTTTGRCWTLTENSTTGELILVGKAITIKQHVIEQLEKENRPINYVEAGEDGCDLLLPDIMPYKFLIREYLDNEDTFESQLNQNPRSVGSTVFDRALMLRSFIPFTEMPFSGPVSITWDFAGPFNRKKGRDHSVASVAIWDEQGRCYITELIRDRMRPTDLAKAVVDLTKKYHPFVVGIEDAAGARFLEDEIAKQGMMVNDLYVAQICSRIDWIPVNTRLGAKTLRMSAMHPWLASGRLKLANYLLNGQMEVIINEFERCLYGNGKHDDIPDSISYQLRYAPRVHQMVVRDKDKTAFLTNPDQAAFNLLYVDGTDAFGRVGYGQTSIPIISPEPEPEIAAGTPDPSLPPILGAGLNG